MTSATPSDPGGALVGARWWSTCCCKLTHQLPIPLVSGSW
jgi:hypothetical protein